ncbi:MAG: DUF4124 domain-containing protein [Halothiobacillaceae bacterium]|jgi:hypothetical protein|nr:DUF4124 domain-containing protein [Halothiobacillaceae bacterium]MDY0050312.1 DUF4124 domain-containing protein [Halothiobacillaceae bacterium]
MRATAVVCVLLLPLSVHGADVYVCTDAQGRKVFSDEPCGPDAQKMDVRAAPPGTRDENAIDGVRSMARELDERLERDRAEAQELRKLRIEADRQARLDEARQEEQRRQAEDAMPPIIYTPVYPGYLPHPHRPHPHRPQDGFRFEFNTGGPPASRPPQAGPNPPGGPAPAPGPRLPAPTPGVSHSIAPPPGR